MPRLIELARPEKSEAEFVAARSPRVACALMDRRYFIGVYIEVTK